MNNSFKNDLFFIDNIFSNRMVCTVSSVIAKESDVDDLTNILKNRFELKIKSVIIYDINQMNSVPFKLIKKLSVFANKNEISLKEFHKHIIYVAKNRIPKIMLNTLFALKKPLNSYSIIDDLESAFVISDKTIHDLSF